MRNHTNTAPATPTARRALSRVNWKALLLGAILALGPVALGYYLFVTPILQARASLDGEIATLREKNAKSKEVHDHWQEFLAHAADVRRAYDEAIVQIPEIPEREILAGEIERLCAGVSRERGVRGEELGMHSTFFDSGDGKPLQPDKPGFVSVSELPIRLEFRGNWSGYKALVSRLRENERLIEVKSFVMTSRGERSTPTDNINLAVEATTYYKRFVPAVVTPAPAAAGGVPAQAPQGK